MGKIKRKGKVGTAATYINRTQAIKKLQISLSDFRRLCILKGIYPHDPKHRHKLDKGKNINHPATYYLVKDVQFLAHEPLIEKFREFKIFATKLKKYIGRKEHDKADKIINNKPKFTFDHIVKERYPNFADAIRDLDDCLTLCTLFSKLPKSKFVSSEMISTSRRLVVEFMNLMVMTKSLRKVFLSIKGIYFQVEILGQIVTWISPYEFQQSVTAEVDFKVMCTFIDFYISLLGFVNYKLYTDHNLIYPLKFNTSFACNSIDREISLYNAGREAELERLASFNETCNLSRINMDVADPTMIEINADPELVALNQELLNEIQPNASNEGGTVLEKPLNTNLFSDIKFFLNREVPKETLTFVIRCFGGHVSWPASSGIGSTFDESDEGITYQIVDRTHGYSHTSKEFLNRYYIQPQWIFDCVNANTLLPVQPYFPTCNELPAHLSPFHAYVPGMCQHTPTQDGEQEIRNSQHIDEESGVIIKDRFEQKRFVNEQDSTMLLKPNGLGIKKKARNINHLKKPQKSLETLSDRDQVRENKVDSDHIYKKNHSDLQLEALRENEIKAKHKALKKSKVMRTERAPKIEISKIGTFNDLTPNQAATHLNKQQREELKLREMMLSKKHKRLYHKMTRVEKFREKEAKKLSEKRVKTKGNLRGLLVAN